MLNVLISSVWMSCWTSWTKPDGRRGRSVAKSEAHRLGLWHRCFHCWICGSDPEGFYLLLQRRASTKDTWPDYLDITAAGHLSAGEETLDGLREVEEELGLQVNPERLVPLGTHKIEQQLPGRPRQRVPRGLPTADDTPPEKAAPAKRGGRGRLPARPRRRRSTLRDGNSPCPRIHARQNLHNPNTPRGIRPEGRRLPGPGRTSCPPAPVRHDPDPHLLAESGGPKGRSVLDRHEGARHDILSV